MSKVIDDIPRNTGDETTVTPKYQTEDGQPNVALLQDRMPVEYQASSSATILVVILGVMFTMLNYFPLWHTDLWGHLSYGRWIWTNGLLPSTEPLMPLSRGVPMMDTAWLSQLVGYLTMEQFGVAGLQFLYALSILTMGSLLTFAVYRRTSNTLMAAVTLGAFFWCGYQHLIIVRPQLGAMVCFSATLVMATSIRWQKWYWWAIPLCFVFWANLHGSFIVGLALLGALTVGRAIDVLVKTRSLKMMLAETRTRQLLLATELAAAAVLLNPYGIGLYSEVFAIAGNPNLESLIEWDPLTLRMKQGRAAAALALSLIFLYRFSPRRVSFSEVLLLLGLGFGALWSSRMIVWWAPVAAYYIGIHGAAVWKRLRRTSPSAPKRGGLYTVSILGLIWIFFAYTPLGTLLIHGGPEDAAAAEKKFRNSVSYGTPVAAVDYLNHHPPQGLIFNTYEYGDYLLWAGPDDLQVFVASHAHLVPEEVWQDYMTISHAGGGWATKLDRYGVNTVVINSSKQEALAAGLEDDNETWEKVYSDNKSVIFKRIKPVQTSVI